MTIEQWLAINGGLVFRVPKGTYLGTRWVDPNGVPCSRYGDGATRVDHLTDRDERIELQISDAAVMEVVTRALRSPGRRAKQGPVVVKRLR